MKSSVFSIISMASVVYGHGRVTSPPSRAPGPAFEAACGQSMYNQMTSDPNGNIENMLQNKAANYDLNTCQLPLCRGYKFDDNKDNVQSYTAGQTIDFQVDIAAPHTGIANVSVVDTSSVSTIGEPLISWTNYASSQTGVAANNSVFSVVLPSGLPSICGTAGNCVLQWWWFSEVAQQTYISCVDFTTGSGGSDTGNGGTAPSSAAPSSTYAPSAGNTPAVNTPAGNTPAGNTPAAPTTLKTSTSASSASTPQPEYGAPANDPAILTAADPTTAPTTAPTTPQANPVAPTGVQPTTPGSKPTSSCKRRRAIRNSGRMYKGASR
ncbi:hypothetical protein CFIMG_002777RA [Ceratocystis fimbriata CBS 114723]|uniref:Chitin-binding type-4 domain-containing protein n=1 Tax=Ceratocystis fimbriata CBS 114723 TaxID=1035309 RepID=A0A2C5XCI2_9PEZI|nr:hypothetical protein CFIMG_002777RA [Ceratocystis fimbriata CBS 114723]